MENNSEKKKYLKTLIGDNIYFSPISLDDIEEYTEMINDIKVSVGLGSVSYTNITDFESEKEFLTSIKKEKMFAVRLLENDELLGNIGFKEVGRLRKAVEIMGKTYDIIIMDMLKEEFQSVYIKRELEKRYNLK